MIGLGLADSVSGTWPLGMSGTMVLLAVGASIPAGALVGTLGRWRRRGVLFCVGLVGFLLVMVGFGKVLKPLSVAADVVPMIGNLVEQLWYQGHLPGVGKCSK